MNEVLLYRYGFLVRHRHKSRGVWVVACIGDIEEREQIIKVDGNFFDFPASLGDAVKIGTNQRGETRKVTRCSPTEWVRDVEVRDEKAVIYIFVHFREDNMKECIEETDSKKLYYVFGGSENTDFREVAISKDIVDKALSARSSYQRRDEPLIYRVGVFYTWSNTFRQDRVFWKHHEETLLAPIFECFSKESVVPFVSSLMVYGVLKGIVIRTTESATLIWTKELGCGILHGTVESLSWRLGDTCDVLFKRCLADSSFGFDCFHDIMSSGVTKNYYQLEFFRDEQMNAVYIQTKAKCRVVTDVNQFVFDVPYFGSISEGLQMWKETLTNGETYSCRIVFQQIHEGGPYEPVVKDILVHEHIKTVNCRIVYNNEMQGICYAILDLDSNYPKDLRETLEFIKIPRRLFCCIGQRSSELHHATLQVKIRPLSGELKKIWVGVDILDHMFSRTKNTILRKVMDHTWLRTEAYIDDNPLNFQKNVAPITLKCFHSQHLIFDPLRECEKQHLVHMRGGRRRRLYVNAQCVISPWNLPVFLLRHVNISETSLEKIIPANLQDLEPVGKVFQKPRSGDLGYSLAVRSNERTAAVPVSVVQEIDRNNTNRERSYPPSVSNRTYYTEIKHASRASSVHYRAEQASTIKAEDHEPCHEKLMEKLREIDEVPTFRQATTSYSLPSISAPTTHPRTNMFEPRRTNTRHSNSRLKLGTREGFDDMNDDNLLDDIVYKNIRFRDIFTYDDFPVANAAFFQRIKGRVENIKIRHTTFFAVEVNDYAEVYHMKKCKFKLLVRLHVKSADLDVRHRSVVIPVGGEFALLPYGFQLGRVYSGLLYFTHADRLLRVSGYGKHVGSRTLVEDGNETYPFDCETVANGRDLKWLRMKQKCLRPSVPYYINDVFELWTCPALGGFVIVETSNLTLDVIDPIKYSAHEMQAVVEPLAGGPYSVRQIRRMHNEKDASMEANDYLICWRVATEFKGEKCKPIFLSALPVPDPILNESKPITAPEGPFYDTLAGHRSYLKHVFELTQERVDRLRAAKDPRVMIADGPALKPDMALRKIDVNTRKERVMKSLRLLVENLDKAHKHGIWEHVKHEEIEKKIELYETMHDNNHSHTVEDRRIAITGGCRIIMDLLMIEGVVKKMQFDCDLELKDLLLVLVDCIALNNTYVRKTDEVQKMLLYFDEQSLHSYDDD